MYVFEHSKFSNPKKKSYATFREGKIERPSIKRQKSALQSFIDQADEKSKSKTDLTKMEKPKTEK